MGQFFVVLLRSLVVQKFLQQFDLFDSFPRVLSFYHDQRSVLTLYSETLIL